MGFRVKIGGLERNVFVAFVYWLVWIDQFKLGHPCDTCNTTTLFTQPMREPTNAHPSLAAIRHDYDPT